MLLIKMGIVRHHKFKFSYVGRNSRIRAFLGLFTFHCFLAATLSHRGGLAKLSKEVW
jgi:hypothetical protein